MSGPPSTLQIPSAKGARSVVRGSNVLTMHSTVCEKENVRAAAGHSRPTANLSRCSIGSALAGHKSERGCGRRVLSKFCFAIAIVLTRCAGGRLLSGPIDPPGRHERVAGQRVAPQRRGCSAVIINVGVSGPMWVKIGKAHLSATISRSLHRSHPAHA
jgi:hypothetical protein